jgi:hypothetical protein
MRKTCIVSFPRCGRHLLHDLFVAAYGLPERHIDRGNPDKALVESRDLVVSHNVQPELESDGRHCIVVTRNPFEALHSFMRLQHPDRLTYSAFEEALFCTNGSDHSTSPCNWINYWKTFHRHHVLLPDYACPRTFVPYIQLVENPVSTMTHIANFVGQPCDAEVAVKKVGPIAFRTNHFAEGSLWDDRLITKTLDALQPEFDCMMETGLI